RLRAGAERCRRTWHAGHQRLRAHGSRLGCCYVARLHSRPLVYRMQGLCGMTATFTPHEACILRVLHLANGWVSQETLVRATWGNAEAEDAGLFMASRHTLRVNVSRIRRKLAPLDWRIETRQGSSGSRHYAGW